MTTAQAVEKSVTVVSPTVLLRTTQTRTITLDKLLILLGSNHLQYPDLHLDVKCNDHSDSFRGAKFSPTAIIIASPLHIFAVFIPASYTSAAFFSLELSEAQGIMGTEGRKRRAVKPSHRPLRFL